MNSVSTATDILKEYDARKLAAESVDCGFPNCARDGHDPMAPASEWCHDIFLDTYNEDVYFAITLLNGEYACYMSVDYTSLMFDQEDLEMAHEVARLVTLYRDRFAALQAGEPPERATINHWMQATDILASVVNGDPGNALCGEKFVARSQGGGSTMTAGAKVCELCQYIYEGLED